MGIILPLQLAMVAARTLGTHFHGSALKRGTAGTLLEQGFDVYTIACWVASGITWFYHGGAMTWALYALASIVLAMLAAEPSVPLVRWLLLLQGPDCRISRPDSAQLVGDPALRPFKRRFGTPPCCAFCASHGHSCVDVDADCGGGWLAHSCRRNGGGDSVCECCGYICLDGANWVSMILPARARSTSSGRRLR